MHAPGYVRTLGTRTVKFLIDATSIISMAGVIRVILSPQAHQQLDINRPLKSLPEGRKTKKCILFAINLHFPDYGDIGGMARKA